MPLYEYECDACGERTETIQRFDDPPLTRCPECQGSLRRLISAPAFQFKGSGWYATDYAGNRSNGGKEQAGEKEQAGQKEQAGEKEKPAAKGDAQPSAKKGGEAKTASAGDGG